jgi:hypothetical protein
MPRLGYAQFLPNTIINKAMVMAQRKTPIINCERLG